MPGDTRDLQQALLVCVKDITPGKTFQKTNSTIHCNTKIFSCTAQEKDALLRYGQLHPCNPLGSQAVSKDSTNSRGKTRTFLL